MVGVTLSNDEGRNQLSVGVQSNERPNVTVTVGDGSAVAFCPDESPNRVNFDVAEIQVAPIPILDFGASGADTNAQPHNQLYHH